MSVNAIDKHPPYLLAISSYAVHGVASLKVFTRVLGSYILPVPSLMLGGLTNIQNIKKFDSPFAELLENTLEIAISRKQQLIFYVGYLGNAQQADVVINAINKYRDIIKTVIVDPVCGDNGRTYVPNGVIEKWAQIITLANIAAPNFTELKLITGHAADAEGAADLFIEKFNQLFPDTGLLLTSNPTADDETGIQFRSNSLSFKYSLPLLPQNYGGSGDLLLSLFIRNHYYQHLPLEQALKLAMLQTHNTIKFSITNNSDQLLLDEQVFNNTTP